MGITEIFEIKVTVIIACFGLNNGSYGFEETRRDSADNLKHLEQEKAFQPCFYVIQMRELEPYLEYLKAIIRILFQPCHVKGRETEKPFFVRDPVLVSL